MKMIKPFKFFLAALPLLLLVSCASESPQSIQDKKTELCTNLARFKTSVAALRSMSPSSTAGDLRKAQDQVRTTFNDVKTVAKNVQNAKVEQLEKAYEDLDKAIKGIPNTATLKQATTSIAPQVSAVQAAEAQMETGLSCP
jgi:PBP1b-binding outer membrane lipoprotein LpoB